MNPFTHPGVPPADPIELLRAAATQAEHRAQHWATRVRQFRLALTHAQGDGDIPPGVLDAAHRTLGWSMPTTVTREQR